MDFNNDDDRSAKLSMLSFNTKVNEKEAAGDA